MSSTSIQTRINAFESNAHNNSDILEGPLSPMTAAALQPVALFPRPPPSPSPSPPNLGRKTSLIDLKDWVVDDGPRTIDSTKTPTQQAFSSGKRLNGKNNGGPLISLDSPPKPKPKPANLSAAFNKKPPPQLPPRKPSYTSLKSVASSSSSPSVDSLTVEHAHRYPPLTLDLAARNNTSSHAPSSSISSFHSVSLSSDTDPSTPGSVANFIATFPMDEEHHARRDADSISLSESYEEVSTSSLASPATEHLINLDWDKAMAKRKVVPPRLPQRPNATRSPILKGSQPLSHPVSRAASLSGSTPTSPIIRPSSSSSILALNNTNGAPNTPPYTPRRAAPPPPPSSRASDRSSIQSTTTTNSFSSSSHSHHSRNTNPAPSILSLKTRRPTPVPLAARKRYEAVFNANILQRRRAEKWKQEKPALLSPEEARGKRAVGWRGLSVDLITGDAMSPQNGSQKQNPGDSLDETVGRDEMLEGGIVRLIWKRSNLESAQLAEIWNECDLTHQGSLSLEAFIKGMWRIDEELRRAQTQALKSLSGAGVYRSSSLLSLNRPAPKIPPRPRDILR